MMNDEYLKRYPLSIFLKTGRQGVLQFIIYHSFFIILFLLKNNCSSVSRILFFLRSIYHLSTFAVADKLYLPTLHAARATPFPTRRSRDILDISTHKVYPFVVLLRQIVRSYRTFSPLPVK